METINQLTEMFKEFPGIGQRQAGRFVYFLLSKNTAYLETLADLILSVKKKINHCKSCFRYFQRENANSALCQTCSQTNRDKSLLMIVPRDIDWNAVEKSHFYKGYYFILGVTVPILETEPEKKIRIADLMAIVRRRSSEGLKEIIIAVNLNPEGENTEDYLIKILKPSRDEFGLKISVLGRGLSTGAELEYADGDTIKNALKNRV